MMLIACAPAAALTPAATNISIPNLAITSDGGAFTLSQPADISSVTVLAVSGVAWTATPTGATVATGQSTIYKFTFAHNGNIGIAPASDSFTITVSSAWLTGVYQDAAATIPATGAVSLPPNVGNTYSFYVKITAPAGAVGLSDTATVTVANKYYTTNGANDAFGDPDRITHSVVTTVPDNLPPVLALTTPADNSVLTISATSVSGTTEPDVNGVYSLSPSGATGTLIIGAGGSFTQVVTLAQGTNTITVQVRDAALNSTTASRTVVVDSIMPLAVIASPLAGSSVEGAVSVTGTAADTNFTQYALHYGPGASPTAWGTITATSTMPVTSGALGAWNTGSLYGDYTLRLTVVDSFGNTSQATTTLSVGNANTFAGTLPVDTWSMVSIPGIPYNPDPKTWFGSSRFEVQRWDPAMAGSDPYLYQYQRTFSVGAGSSFWVKPYDTAVSFNVEAWVPDTTQPFEIPVYAGWNQVGNPYNRAIQWDLFQFRNSGTGETKTLSQAVAAGWLDGSFYSYSSNNYALHGTGENLDPQTGYFMKALVSGALVIDPGAGRPEGVARIVRPRYEFKLQLSAQGGELRDTDNFAGILKTSSDAWDPADSGEPPLVEPYLTLHFPHEDWPGRAAGRYAADLRPEPETSGAPPVKTWTFVVQTSEPGAPITVSWPNAGTLPENYDVTITDEQTGARIDPRTQESYQYTADAGAARTFQLTARKLGAMPQQELALALAPGWNLISVPLEPELTDARVQLGDDMINPAIYQYYDTQYYDPDSPQRVDIQAGLGYWIFSENSAQVDFEGVPTDPSVPVDVPLATGWNLIGNPYNTAVAFDDTITVQAGGETLPLSQAVLRGWLDGRLFHFNAATGAYEVLGQGVTMQPLQGYIIKSPNPCILRFSAQ